MNRGPLLLASRLLESARQSPEREAVVDGNRRASYSQLRQEASAVARFLSEEGLAPGARVAILMENSVELVATLYGIWMAGGVSIALNTAAKARDHANWLRHSGAGWLVAAGGHGELPALLEREGGGLRVITVGQSRNPLSVEPIDYQRIVATVSDGSEELASTDPSAIASIIYTSGTTGEPKGVALTHRNLASNVASILRYLELSEQDRIVNVLPFYYSYGNSVLHTHLAAGGTVICENSFMYPAKVVERMVSEGATGFSGVPSTFALLMSRTRLGEYDLGRLRYLTQAGGAMAPSAVRAMTELLPHVRFFVMYGQTEATARLTYLPPEKLGEKTGSVGIPIPGVEIDIRDERDEPVNSGATGQIWARGDNIMAGYWENPERTREVLQDGWLKTGDLAHFDEERYIFIDGRQSDMIKVGANRISPLEVEEVISELAEVEEVAALGMPDELLGQVVKVVVVPRPGATLEKRAIQQYCLKHLASYKIPKQIEIRDRLPRTASGKLQRHLL